MRADRYYRTAFGLAGFLIAAFGLLGAMLVACAPGRVFHVPHGTGTGTFRYCAYTVEQDGVHVDEHQSVPCLLTDVREADDRSGFHHHPRVRGRYTSEVKSKTPGKPVFFGGGFSKRSR